MSARSFARSTFRRSCSATVTTRGRQRTVGILANHIAGARLVELPSGTGGFHWYGRADAIIEEVGRFLGEIGDEEASLSRQLATVMFTDIVDSTVRAVELGDTKWRELLSRHDDVVRAMLSRYRGTLVKHTGDGVLATFDGPARGVKCAQAIATAMAPLGLEIRAGLHTGEIERRGDDLVGVAVHIGARVGALAGSSEVLVSSDREGSRRRLRPRLRRRGRARAEGRPRHVASLPRGERMNERPETKYAWNGDVALAYQVFGDGPVDLVYMQGFASHVDLNWESPFLARFLRGLGQLARVIHTDRRGFGMLGPLLARRRRAARGPGRRPRRGDGRGRLRARCHLRLVRHGVGGDAVRGDEPRADRRPGPVRSLRDVLRVGGDALAVLGGALGGAQRAGSR